MKGKAFKYIIFLATISVVGIFLIQFVYLRSSYNYSEKQFRESAAVALKEVAWQILLAGGNSSNFDSSAALCKTRRPGNLALRAHPQGHRRPLRPISHAKRRARPRVHA